MNNSRKTSVLYTAIFIALMVLFLTTATLSTFGVAKRAIARTDTSVYGYTSLHSEYVNSLLQKDLNTITDFALNSSDYKSHDITELKQIMKNLADNNGFLNVMIIGDDDVISYNDCGAAAAVRVASQAALNSKSVFSDSYYDSACDKKINIIAAPICGDFQRIIGVAAGIIPSDRYCASLDLSVSGDDINDSNGYVVNADGNPVFLGSGAIKDIDFIGENLFDGTFSNNLVSQSLIDFRSSFAKTDACGTVKSQINGVSFIAYYSKLDANENLRYVVIFQESTAYEGIFAYVRMIMVLFAFFIVIIGILAAFYFAVLRRSITRLRSANNEISRIAYVDTLTGYSTWDKFELDSKRLRQSEYRKYALISFDIDKFKAINDMYGHEHGNRILKLIADVVNRNIAENETFTRASADNFYILMHYQHEEEIITRIQGIIQALEYEISDFVPVISFGIYLIINKSLSLRRICDSADIAKSSVKYGNRSAYAFYEESMLESLREEKSIENEMQSALDAHEFCVFFQPKVSLKGEATLTGAEALVRWIKGDAVVSPAKFIPLFEKNRFVIKLDYYVMDQVCRRIKQWEQAGYKNLLISVNMSRVHLTDPNFVEQLYDICRGHGVDPSEIEIEITESAAYEALEVLEKVFGQLKDYGFHISIDDFGSGYSSLNMLKDLPADVLKIDRAFLTESGFNKRASDIISYVIKMARSLGMQTICEGIETEEQVELLRGLGCDMAQGYYFAKPMPIDSFEELMRSGKPLGKKKEA